jgi:hypothetical protein
MDSSLCVFLVNGLFITVYFSDALAYFALLSCFCAGHGSDLISFRPEVDLTNFFSQLTLEYESCALSNAMIHAFAYDAG